MIIYAIAIKFEIENVSIIIAAIGNDIILCNYV